MMKRTTMLVVLGLAGLGPPTFGQDQEPEGPPPEAAEPERESREGPRFQGPEQEEPEGPTLPEQFRRPSAQEELVQELREIFHEVERRLAEIDDQLADAGAGEVPLEAVEGAGIDDLLRDSRGKSEECVSGINRILEIAGQLGGQGGGGGNQQQQQQGQGPLDEERDKGPKERENTPDQPEQPAEHQDGEKPEEGQQQDREVGDNRQGDPRNDETGPAISHGEDAEEWGFLPERVQERFRNQGRDALPAEYRDWIDAYYRRLNVPRR